MLFALSVSIQAQVNYKVIKVSGEIEIIKTGQDLESGVIFEESEKLDFKTKASRATVINPKKGRMILSYDETSPNKSSYLPPMGNISTRGGVITNIIDLKNHFNGDLVLLNKIELSIPIEDFKMDEENFFFIKYLYNDEEINKKLSYEDTKLIISKSDLYMIDGSPIEIPESKNMRLYYMNNGSHSFIAEFVMVAPDDKSLKDEIEIIIDEMKDKSKEEKITEVNSFIIDFYGKVDIDDVTEWLEKNFDL